MRRTGIDTHLGTQRKTLPKSPGVRAWLFAGLILTACGPSAPAPRLAGVRAPRSADCDDTDPTRCALPWPSSAFLAASDRTATGVKVSIAPRSLPVRDSPRTLLRADGFSTVTPLAVGFSGTIDPASLGTPGTEAAVRLYAAQPGRVTFGQPVPLRFSTVTTPAGDESLVLAYPLVPLEHDADYVAVVLDSVRTADGATPAVPRTVAIASGAATPSTDDEATLAAYHAPARALLTAAGVSATQVLRLWDFTTRSQADVTDGLRRMRQATLDAVSAGTTTVTVTSATLISGAHPGVDVRGTVGGLPSFFTSSGDLSLDTDGHPQAVGVHDQPFRVVLPSGTGNFPLAVYGHGTGGNVNDKNFDADFLALGAGKLNLDWRGWNEASAVATLAGFAQPFTGSGRSTAGLMQAQADAAAIESLLASSLGDALAQPRLAGQDNPAAGRRVDLDHMVYVGGSLGGCEGMVHALLEPRIRGAVLNVPGGGWAQWLPWSQTWGDLSFIYQQATPNELDLALGISMSQTNWDPIDGAVLAVTKADDDVFLFQESMGDPILPNLGTALAATSMGATQVGRPLELLWGSSEASEVVGRSALTQFRVPASETAPLSIHGFAVNDTPAGVAAREQFLAFFESVVAGTPRVEVPPTCQAHGASCDFSAP